MYLNLSDSVVENSLHCRMLTYFWRFWKCVSQLSLNLLDCWQNEVRQLKWQYFIHHIQGLTWTRLICGQQQRHTDLLISVHSSYYNIHWKMFFKGWRIKEVKVSNIKVRILILKSDLDILLQHFQDIYPQICKHILIK